MPRATLLFAGLLSLCLAVPGFVQESDQPSQSQDGRTQNQQNDNQQKQDQSRDKPQQLVDVSLDQGQTLTIPAGAELLKLTVAVPESVHAGQEYRYRARVENVSESATLANVQLVQINGDKIDIEQAQLNNPNQKQQNQSKQKQNQQKQNQQNQRTRNQNQQNQEGQNPPAQNQDQQNPQDRQSAQQRTEGSNLNWQIGQLKPGDSRELTVTAVATDTGKLDHCFAVRYEEAICTQVDVVKPTVTITKTAPELASVCEPFEYRYELKNTGTGVARDFIVRDQLPEGLVTKSGKNEIAFRIPELQEGQTESFAAQVHSMKPGEYQSRAVVEQKSGETRQSKQVVTEVVAPELDMAIQGPRAIKAGEGGNFDVTVTNKSDVPARNVVLTVDPGENADVTNAGKGDARRGGKSFQYDLGDMDPGESKNVSITLDSKEQGNVNLSATARSLCARDGQEAVAVAEAEANMQARVLRITSLLLSVVDTDDVIPTGESITYRIRVRNQGSFPDKNVNVNLNLPSGLQFEEAKGSSEAKANGQRVSLGPVKEIQAGETLEWHVTANTRSAGEKIVEATLDSDGLNSTVESQEVSTIYDDSKQTAKDSGNNQSDSNQSDSNQSENEESENEESESNQSERDE